jgi:hypothetical protein
METSNRSRETILNAIRSNLPKAPVEHPGIRTFQRPGGDLESIFEQRLKEAGGAAHNVGSVAEAQSLLIQLYPGAKLICSAVPTSLALAACSRFVILMILRMSMSELSGRNLVWRKAALFGSPNKILWSTPWAFCRNI